MAQACGLCHCRFGDHCLGDQITNSQKCVGNVTVHKDQILGCVQLSYHELSEGNELLCLYQVTLDKEESILLSVREKVSTDKER